MAQEEIAKSKPERRVFSSKSGFSESGSNAEFLEIKSIQSCRIVSISNYVIVLSYILLILVQTAVRHSGGLFDFVLCTVLVQTTQHPRVDFKLDHKYIQRVM